MRTAIGHGLIVPKPKPNGESIAALRCCWQKGKRLIFRYLTVDLCGNANDPGDVGMSHWKSYLFFLTAYGPGIGLSRDRAIAQEEHFNLRDVSSARDDY